MPDPPPINATSSYSFAGMGWTTDRQMMTAAVAGSDRSCEKIERRKGRVGTKGRERGVVMV